MIVNKFYITLPKSDKQIDIPIIPEWFNLGQDESIDKFERKAVEEIIGEPYDFETVRFSNRGYFDNNIEYFDINYEFNFYSGSPTTLVSTDWVSSYLAEGFTPQQIYYYDNVFSKSFFKLDLYDLPDEKAQTNYITIILPTQQGFTELAVISPPTAQVQLDPVEIKKPKFRLDFVGSDKEGFFIYWLKKQDFISADTFYMTAKFFDARNGQFTKMTNTIQTSIPGTYTFSSEKYFYYKVSLNYNDYTYMVFDSNNVRVGTKNNPIKWFEYVNP